MIFGTDSAIMSKEKVKKIKSGVYLYKGYTLMNLGYHHPDKCIWWEATDCKGFADYHATTKKDLIVEIDEGEKYGIQSTRR